MPFNDCLEKMAAIVRWSQHVKFWVELHTGQCVPFEINRTTEAPRDNPNHKLETALVCVGVCVHVCVCGQYKSSVLPP